MGLLKTLRTTTRVQNGTFPTDYCDGEHNSIYESNDFYLADELSLIP